MNTDQARRLCALFGVHPDEAVGAEPRYIAVQRVFDDVAADEALGAHNERWTPKPPTPINTGTKAISLKPRKGRTT